MGIKKLHKYAKRLQAYNQTRSIIELLKRERVKITFVDACCVLFDSLFQKGVLGRLQTLRAQEHLSCVRSSNDNDYTTEEVLQVIAKDIIRRVQLLHASGTRVCLVIDGKPLKAKLRTIQSRQSKFTLGKFNNLERHPEAAIMPEHKDKHWRSFNDKVKNSVVQILQDTYNVSAYNVDNPADTSFFVAPFEADPQIVYFAENCQEKTCIYSYDSDLFCYPGAMDSVRIIKVDSWCDPLLPGITVSSKATFLDALKLRLSTEENYDNAERRMLVAAAYSGNDYAPNVPGKALSTLIQYAQQSSHHGEISSVNELSDKIQAKLGVAKCDPLSKKFSVAVCQFAAPTVNSIEGNRVIYNPWNYNATQKIRELVDGTPESPPSDLMPQRQRLSQSILCAKNEKQKVIQTIAAKIRAKQKITYTSMGSYQKHTRRSFTFRALSLHMTSRPQGACHSNHFYINILQKLLQKVCKV